MSVAADILTVAAMWLGVAALIIFDIGLWPNQINNNASGPEQTCDIPEGHEQRRIVEQTFDQCWHSEERQHKRREKWYWTLSLVFGAIGMGAAIVAAIVTVSALNASWKAVSEAHNGAEQARRQADSAEAGLRAFLDYTSFSFSYGNNTVTVTPKLENTGNTQALNVVYGTNCSEDSVVVKPAYVHVLGKAYLPQTKRFGFFNTPIQIGSHTSWPGAHCTMDESQWTESGGFSIVTVARYYDVFGSCHVIMNCGLIFYDSKIGKNNLETAICGPNCADKSCNFTCSSGPFDPKNAPDDPFNGAKLPR